MIENSTLSGNRANRFGSGFASFGEGPLVLNNVTVTRNIGPPGVAAAFNFGSSSVRVANTIIAQNTALDCAGAFASTGFNLIGNNQGCTGFGVSGDLVGTPSNPLDAQLSDVLSLLDGTPTHALLPDSPAIDAGNPSPLGSGPDACKGTDQRGAPRPVDGNGDQVSVCDIGAFELFATRFSEIKVPIRWCGVSGAPAINNPALVGASSADDVMLRRLDSINSNIFAPSANMRFRSGATAKIPRLPYHRRSASVGRRVYIDFTSAGDREALDVLSRCRDAWERVDPTVKGIVAVQINRFVEGHGSGILANVGGWALPSGGHDPLTSRLWSPDCGQR